MATVFVCFNRRFQLSLYYRPRHAYFSYPNRSSLVLQFADGCGFNKYRDAHGICRRKYIFGGRFKKIPSTERGG